MDNNASPQVKSGEASLEVKAESQASKKRKMIQKRVVSVRIGENEGLPSDLWSWRKYGQKPIKGSPYPRGYYKCSTSRGCSAKKQVERSSTDSSMLIITYTSTHNHPDPTSVSTTNSARQPKESETETTQNLPITSKEEIQKQLEQEMDHSKIHVTNDQVTKEENFHYLQSPIEDPFKLNMEKHHIDLILEEKPLCYAANLSESKSEELDYFDELEELPMSSSVLQFTRSIFSDERIPVALLD